jgi:F-type H+-transporting ATPase subunit delta
MANLTTVARPYAKAILQLAKHDDSYQQWTQALAFLAKLAEDPMGEKILSNRAVSITEKADFICNLMPDVLTPEAKNLVRLLAVSRRLLILPALYRLFEVMRKKAQGAVTVHLTLTQQTDLSVDNLGENITVVEDIDPTLIGGGIAKIGNRVVDASIIGRLIAMRDQLRQ